MLQQSLTSFPRISTRLSHSVMTYSFPVSSGQNLVRLHFNPASYPDFDRSKAVFSVKTGRYTLLKDFEADAVDGIVREFCVHVEEQNQVLDLTFTPTNQDSYAFISGIEIVSMPEYLVYTPISKPNNKLGSLGLKQISHNTKSSSNKNYMYEVLYRINIGGRAISPEEDTGMFRFWSNEEGGFLPDASFDARPVNFSIELDYSKISPYTAPDDIYRTARTMGPNGTENKSNNLTWDYLVDPGFFYILRLHFCEFQSEINDTNDRVFLIYIKDEMVEEAADVMKWAGGRGIPYRKDYVVFMPHNNEQDQKVNLSVKLQANPDDAQTRYTNVILNGLEIFKANNHDHDKNLTNQFLQSPIQSSKNSNIKMVAVIIPVVVGGIAAMLVFGLFVFRRCRTLSKDESSNDRTTIQLSLKKANKTHKSNLPSALCRYFSLQQIKDATNNFDDNFIIGVGGFGNVYKGYIDDGVTQVAIKRLKIGSKQGAHEFRTEIEILSQLRHRHLVSLIGYCKEHNEMILIYDYMCQGTLRSHLYGNKDTQPLSWKRRLKLCIGAAKGLHYLHTGTEHFIIHRDVKTTNILVDDKWVARVSDFGLSKVGATSTYKGHVSTVVKGSFGYLDPEYCRRQQLSEKSDVYSFGVVLCEVLCASPPLISTADKTHLLLAKWVQEHIQEKQVTQIIDSNIKNEITFECFKKFMQIVVSCIQDEGIKRPSMDDVVRGLEVASRLQESSNEENVELRISLEDGDAWLFEEGRTSNNTELASSSSKNSSLMQNIGMSGIVFSQLKDMEGR